MKISPEFFVDLEDDKKKVRFIVNGKYLCNSNHNNSDILTHCICTDDEGYEYYNVPNIYNYKIIGENIILYSFSQMPMDMITTIRENDGDVINRGMFGTEHVRRYLDREYGESLRQKSLEGWKDAKFGWGLVFSSGGFGGSSLLSNNLEFRVFSHEKVFSCSSKEEAQKLRDYLVDRCKNVLIKDYEDYLIRIKEMGTDDKDDRVESLWKIYTCDARLKDHVLSEMFLLYASPQEYSPEELKEQDRFRGGKCLSICQVVLD